MIAFRVEQWRAWAPGLSTQQNWHDWAQAPTTVTESAQQPECLSLPPMQRRRLSRLSRMTMEVASPLCGEDEQLPFVFGSRHGETTRTLNLLHDVAGGQPLSPTHFGLSVHNAIAGEADTFEHTMLEAATMLAAGAPSVLAVIAEEMPPAAYDGWINDVPFSYAVALRLGRIDVLDASSTETCWKLALGRHEGEATTCVWPHALDFLRALNTAETSLAHTWKTRQWQWQRTR